MSKVSFQKYLLYLFSSIGTFPMHNFLCLITNEPQILSGWKEAEQNTPFTTSLRCLYTKSYLKK